MGLPRPVKNLSPRYGLNRCCWTFRGPASRTKSCPRPFIPDIHSLTGLPTSYAVGKRVAAAGRNIPGATTACVSPHPYAHRLCLKPGYAQV